MNVLARMEIDNIDVLTERLRAIAIAGRPRHMERDPINFTLVCRPNGSYLLLIVE